VPLRNYSLTLMCYAWLAVAMTAWNVVAVSTNSGMGKSGWHEWLIKYQYSLSANGHLSHK